MSATDRRVMTLCRTAPFWLLCVAVAACSAMSRTSDAVEPAAPTEPSEPGAVSSPGASSSATPAPPLAKAANAEPVLPGKPPSRPLRELFETLSERDRYSSPSYISSEASQLQVAPLLLARTQPGGAYIGVGPEQNYSYIALVKPEIAFIVDTRRRNALLHLLYKAIFDEARTRSEFLCLLVGRPYDASDEPSRDAPIADIIKHVETLGLFPELNSTTLARLIERIENSYQIKLSPADQKTLTEINRAFYEHQLDIQPELFAKTNPRYPKLRDQLALRAPDGRQLGFLANESAFRYVKRMHAENRIIPIVGDLGGTQALPGIVAYLAAGHILLNTFYLSNVEETLFESKTWPKWVKNAESLPIDERSLFVRSWVKERPPHPRQLPEERTTTLVQRIMEFRNREHQGSGWRSYQALAFDASNETGTASH